MDEIRLLSSPELHGKLSLRAGTIIASANGQLVKLWLAQSAELAGFPCRARLPISVFEGRPRRFHLDREFTVANMVLSPGLTEISYEDSEYGVLVGTTARPLVVDGHRLVSGTHFERDESGALLHGTPVVAPTTRLRLASSTAVGWWPSRRLKTGTLAEPHDFGDLRLPAGSQVSLDDRDPSKLTGAILGASAQLGGFPLFAGDSIEHLAESTWEVRLVKRQREFRGIILTDGRIQLTLHRRGGFAKCAGLPPMQAQAPDPDLAPPKLQLKCPDCQGGGVCWDCGGESYKSKVVCFECGGSRYGCVRCHGSGSIAAAQLKEDEWGTLATPSQEP